MTLNIRLMNTITVHLCHLLNSSNPLKKFPLSAAMSQIRLDSIIGMNIDHTETIIKFFRDTFQTKQPLFYLVLFLCNFFINIVNYIL